MLQPSHHTAKSYRTPQVAAGALFGAKRQVAPPLRPFPSEVSLGTQQGLVDGRGTRALEVPVFRRAGAHNNVTHAADYVVQPVPHNDSFEASAVLGRNVEKETRTIDPKRDRLSVAPPPVARVPGLQEFSAARMSNAMSGAANWPTHLSDADMGRVARTVMAPAGKAVPQAPVVVVPDPTRRLVAPTLHPRTVTVAAAVPDEPTPCRPSAMVRKSRDGYERQVHGAQHRAFWQTLRGGDSPFADPSMAFSGLDVSFR